MASEKQVAYTAEQVEQISQAYQRGDTVEEIAKAVGKTARSVTAKLAQLGIYKSKEKAQGSTRVTKAQLVDQVAQNLELDRATIHTLEKCEKVALEALAYATRRG